MSRKAVANKRPSKNKKQHRLLRSIAFLLLLAVALCIALYSAFDNDKPQIDIDPPPPLSSDLRYTSFLGGNGNVPIPSKIDLSVDNKVGLFETHFIDVGQGDSILIRCPDGVDILIDGGSGTSNPSAEDTNNRLLDYLASVNLDKIDYLIATHPDADHINMLDNVLDKYEVSNIYYNFIDVEDTKISKTLKLFEQKAIAEKATLVRFDGDGDIYYIKEDSAVPRYNMTIVAPGCDRFKDSNSSSPIIIMQMYNRKLVLTGDAPKDDEYYFIETYSKLKKVTYVDCDFLKVGHHGSETSTSAAFLDFIKCEFAVISVGLDNSYGHPNQSILDRLGSYKMETYSTTTQGQTVLYIDFQGDFAFGIKKGTPPLYPLGKVPNYFYYQEIA